MVQVASKVFEILPDVVQFRPFQSPVLRLDSRLFGSLIVMINLTWHRAHNTG